MSARLNAVREACKLEPQRRTEEHINDIVEFVKDVKFFTKLTNLQQRALCRTMTHEAFGPREYIFKKDEIGEKFYIVLAGSVSVQIPSTTQCPNGIHPDKCDCPNRPLEHVVYLEQGMGFGELALQSDQPRSASIQTSEITETLVTKRSDYEQYAGQLHRQFIEQRVRFLRQFPRIEEALQRCLVSTQDIAAMANCLSETSYGGNEMVVRQGDVVENMIFVRKGQLAMLRLVDVDNLCEANGEPCEGAVDYLGSTRRGRSTAQAEGLRTELMHASGSEVSLSTNGGGGIKGPSTIQDRAIWATTLACMMFEEKKKMASEAPPPESDSPPSEKIRSPGVLAFLARRRAESKEDSQSTTAAAPGEMRRRRAMAANVFVRQVSEDYPRAQRLWNRLRTAWKTACIINRLKPVNGKWVSGSSPSGNQDAGMRHVAQMLDVSAARKKYAQYRSREMSHKRATKKRSPSEKLVGQQTLSGKPMPNASRRKLLRIGTVGAFQYFGDRQVISGERYPISLVSDPVADIYLMSKHDIQRRLPKKLFAALFVPEKEAVPNDIQTLEMHRQTERWNVFRRSLHGEAMSARPGSIAAAGASMSMPLPVRSSPNAGAAVGFGRVAGSGRNDAISNLAFLGVSPESVPEVLPVPRATAAPLSSHDEICFSQSSAAFLRKFELLRKDPELRNALLRDGTLRRYPIMALGSGDEDLDKDPNAFTFDRHWAKLGKFSMGLDPLHHEDAPVATVEADAFGRSAAGRRGQQQQSQQRKPWNEQDPSASPGVGAARYNAGSPIVSVQMQQQLVGRPPVSRGSAVPSRGSITQVAEKGGASGGGLGASAMSSMTCSTELPQLSSARSLAVSNLSVDSSGFVGGSAESARGPRRRGMPMLATG
mmetsp:Transcript_108162/g.312570  ORF Transcript_108162/g.312570 Transcript_108162/m.312570 type:complete len:881 (-) Transcript_108162:172-2814(-)